MVIVSISNTASIITLALPKSDNNINNNNNNNINDNIAQVTHVMVPVCHVTNTLKPRDNPSTMTHTCDLYQPHDLQQLVDVGIPNLPKSARQHEDVVHGKG